MAQFDIDIELQDQQAERQIEALAEKLSTKLATAGKEASDSTESFSEWLKAASVSAGFAATKMLELNGATKPLAAALTPAFNQMTGITKEAQEAQGVYNSTLDVISSISRAIAVFNLGKFLLLHSTTIKSTFLNILQSSQVLGKHIQTAGVQLGTVTNGAKMLGQRFGGAAMSSGKLLAGLIRMGPQIAIIVGALIIAKKLIDGAFASLSRVQRENIFGVSVQHAEELRKVLPGVLTLTDATREALKFRQSGFTKAETIQAAQLAKTISALTGETKQASLEMLRAGSLSQKVLTSLRMPQALLDKAFNDAKKSSQDQLTQMQKNRIMIDVLSKRYGHMSKDVAKAFQANPIQSFMTSVRAAGQEIKKLFVDDLGFVIRFLGKALKFALQVIIVPIRTVIRGVRTLLQFTGVLAKTTKLTGEAGAAAERLRKGLDKMEKGYNKTHSSAQAATRATNKYRAALEASTQAAKNGFSDARSGFAGLAGDVGSILSQQASVQKEITSLGLKYAGAVYAGTQARLQDLISMRIQGKLTQAQLNAAVKINALQTGLSIKRIQFLKTNRENTALLRRQGSLTEESFKIEQSRLALQQKSRAVGLQEFTFKRGIEATLLRVMELESKLSALSGKRKQQAALQLVTLRKQASQAQQLLRTFQTTQRVQLEMDKQQIEAQRVEARASRTKAAMERASALTTQRNALAAINRELAEGQGRLTATAKLEADNQSRRQALLQQRTNNLIEIERITGRIAALQLSGQARTVEMEKVKALQAQNDLIGKQEGALRRLLSVQKDNLTVMGGVFKSMADRVGAFSQTFGQTITSSFNEGVKGVGGVISTAMEQLVSGVDDVGANAGKTVLTMLGNLAMTMGSLFMAEGFAQMWVPPYTGAPAMAGGAALMALGGAIKGMGSLMDAPPAAKQLGGGSVSAPSGKLPGQTTSKEDRPTTVIHNWAVSSDLIAVDRRETTRRMNRFASEQRRDGLDPFPSGGQRTVRSMG